MQSNKKQGSLTSPLLGLDIFLEMYQRRLDNSKFIMHDMLKLETLARQNKWKNQFNYQPWLNSPHDAIVITSTNQKIIWVSYNFAQMTGYASHEVLHRHPGFLQGKNTSKDSTQKITSGITEQLPVINSTVINYKKNGEEYICGLKIHPVYDIHNSLVNFIAFETELVA